MKKLANIRIMVDPGHGGRTPGAVRKGMKEKDVNLAIAKKLKDVLNSYGATVRMTRYTDETVSLIKRKNMANKFYADIFVSIHCNTNPDKKICGAETYVYKAGDTRALASEKLAKCILTNLGKIGLKEDGRVRPDTESEGGKIYVLHETKMPATTVEVAYMTCPTDMKYLRSKHFRKKAAEAICEGIIEYFKNVNNKIVDLEYNPPGKRDRSKLNEEYVEIKNVGKKLQDFAGWTLEDKAGHKFYFTSRREDRISWCSVLKPGESMKVYTGSGTNERYGTKRYFNYRMPIWNNIEGDRATLRANTGKVITQYTYKITKAPHRKLKEPKTLIRNNKTKETHLSGKDACYWVSLIRDASTITGTIPTCYFCAAWYEKKIEIIYEWLEGKKERKEEKEKWEKWEE